MTTTSSVATGPLSTASSTSVSTGGEPMLVPCGGVVDSLEPLDDQAWTHSGSAMLGETSAGVLINDASGTTYADLVSTKVAPFSECYVTVAIAAPAVAPAPGTSVFLGVYSAPKGVQVFFDPNAVTAWRQIDGSLTESVLIDTPTGLGIVFHAGSIFFLVRAGAANSWTVIERDPEPAFLKGDSDYFAMGVEGMNAGYVFADANVAAIALSDLPP
jgi:hypothetical protein